MATSAQTLSTIIETLSTKFKFDKDVAITFLATSELLPKKLLPKNNKDVKQGVQFASKKAEEYATEHNIVPDGDGSGKNGKWTLKDIESLMTKPVTTKVLISPNALNLANEHKINIVGRKGTGKDDRIVLKDVESWLAAENDNDGEIDISPRALQEANSNGITKDELSLIRGSGKDGRIVLTDMQLK